MSRPGAELMGEISCFYFRILIFFHAHDLTHLCGQTKFRTQALKVDSCILKSSVNNTGSNMIACLSPSLLSQCGSPQGGRVDTLEFRGEHLQKFLLSALAGGKFEKDSWSSSCHLSK